jgi:hypothetical protein
MDWGALIKIAASIGVSIVTVATAGRAINKLKRHIAEYREITAPQPAQPYLQLGFQWRGDLRLNMIHPPEIVFRIGNRQNRILYLNKIQWCAPVYRLHWDAKGSDASGQTIQPGQGLTFKFDPEDTLEPIIDSGFWTRYTSQIRLICGLRLSVQLQSGEERSIPAPRVLKLYLAYLHHLPTLARNYIRFQSFLRP